METVLLPSWKLEPVSPPSSVEDAALLVQPDDELFYPDFDHVKFEDDLQTCESKAEVASHILENLEHLMDLDDLIKEEPFLLDEKMLPILDEVEPSRAIAVPVPMYNLKMEYPKQAQQASQQYLLNEFEFGSIYNVVELTRGTLTPPQTPPAEQTMLTTLEPISTGTAPSNITEITEKAQPLTYAPMPYRSTASPVSNTPIEYRPLVATPQPSDIARELAVVDELVRTRVEDMQWTSGPSSPDSSSCSNSNFGDCSSSEDPEWAPEPFSAFGEANGDAKVPRKRSKPYSKSSTEDKKSRKKEQNKNAATRYRLKKKAEVEEILTEEKKLLEKNNELGTKITDLNREIKYLKGLMRDLFKAKGLIN